MTVKSIQPQYGVNYGPGYVGFTNDGDFVSEGIAYFERWDRLGKISVSHTFIVASPDHCIEAHIKGGVQVSPLAKYFDDPSTAVFFRKPLGWNPEIAGAIVKSAAEKVGCGYATGLIVEEAMADSFVGHWVNKFTHYWPHRFFSALLGSDTSDICSELVAYALNAQPIYRGRGILANPADTIDPQELFEDTVIFEDWQEQLERTLCATH